MSKKISKSNQSSPEIKELKEQLARTLADYSNLEKRVEAQRQMFVTMATMTIINKMIAVLDDLYLSNDHLQDAGLKLTIEKFLSVLKSEGLAEIDVSTPFNPETMECVSTVEGEENQIITVHKKGYTLNGQVIRPAQVIVGKKTELTS